mmetsp:Transcript_139582/g.348099  ORF Transcript_139582/g.348099 Transcript_139582/m.348099 type:complete len:258 (-) Transcript_139582:32-805(-)
MPSDFARPSSLARRCSVDVEASSPPPQHAAIASATSSKVRAWPCPPPVWWAPAQRFFCWSVKALAASASPLRPGAAGSPKASAMAAARARGAVGLGGATTVRAWRMETSGLPLLRINACKAVESSVTLDAELMDMAKERKLLLEPPAAAGAGGAMSLSATLSFFLVAGAGGAEAVLAPPAFEVKRERLSFAVSVGAAARGSFFANRLFSADEDKPKVLLSATPAASLRARFGGGVEFFSVGTEGSGLFGRGSCCWGC